MRRGGYYTVEATFVVSICVWVMIALLYGGFYIHDKMVIESVANERISQWIYTRYNERISEDDEKTELLKKLTDDTFLLKPQSVTLKGSIAEYTISVKYSLPISLSLLKKILSSGDGSTTSRYKRESVHPAMLKWSTDSVKKSFKH